MCARYTLSSPILEIGEEFEVDVPEDVRPRYNIAPSQNVLVVRQDTAGRHAAWVRWGLVPPWADDLSIGQRMINARAETLDEKPAYRTPLRKRRCLVPASGFFEWGDRFVAEVPAQGSLFEEEAPTAEKVRQPYLFRVDEGRVFAFAGLWEAWAGPDGPVETCTLITTEPNELVGRLHDRMPAILRHEDYAAWLEPLNGAAEPLLKLLRPFPAERMDAYPVSRRLNRPGPDDPQLVERVA